MSEFPYDESILPEMLINHREIENVVFRPYGDNIERFKEIVANSDRSIINMLYRMILCSANSNRRYYKTLGDFWAMLPRSNFNIENTYFINYLLKREIALPSNFFYPLHEDFPDYKLVEDIFENGTIGQTILNDNFDEFVQMSTEVNLYSHMINIDGILKNIISVAAYFGASRIFNWCLINQFAITDIVRIDAIIGGNIEIVESLANLNFSFEDCIDVAIKYHQDEIFSWIFSMYSPNFSLVQCIKDCNSLALVYGLKLGYNVNMLDTEGDSPLNWASFYGAVDLCHYLLINGANLEQINSSDVQPLAMAANQGYFDLAKLFIEKGANVNSIGDSNRTPLFFAVANNHPSIVELLLQNGARTDLLTIDSLSITFIACFNGSKESLDVLLSHGVKFKGDEISGAAACPRLDVIKYLIDQGQNINVIGPLGDTPLTFAIKSRYVANVKLLLELGADPTIKNSDGLLPIDLCILPEMKEIVHQYMNTSPKP